MCFAVEGTASLYVWRGLQRNEDECSKKSVITKVFFLALQEACKAIFWPPAASERFGSSEFSVEGTRAKSSFVLSFLQTLRYVAILLKGYCTYLRASVSKIAPTILIFSHLSTEIAPTMLISAHLSTEIAPSYYTYFRASIYQNRPYYTYFRASVYRNRPKVSISRCQRPPSNLTRKLSIKTRKSIEPKHARNHRPCPLRVKKLVPSRLERFLCSGPI